MKIYQLHYHDNCNGRCYSWFTSDADAVAAEKMVRAEPDVTSAEVNEVEFPRSKQGVIDWLNIHLTRNNG